MNWIKENKHLVTTWIGLAFIVGGVIGRFPWRLVFTNPISYIVIGIIILFCMLVSIVEHPNG